MGMRGVLLGMVIGAAAVMIAVAIWPLIEAHGRYSDAKSSYDEAAACEAAAELALRYRGLGLVSTSDEWHEKEKLSCSISRLRALAE